MDCTTVCYGWEESRTCGLAAPLLIHLASIQNILETPFAPVSGLAACTAVVGKKTKRKRLRSCSLERPKTSMDIGACTPSSLDACAAQLFFSMHVYASPLVVFMKCPTKARKTAMVWWACLAVKWQASTVEWFSGLDVTLEGLVDEAVYPTSLAAVWPKAVCETDDPQLVRKADVCPVARLALATAFVMNVWNIVDDVSDGASLGAAEGTGGRMFAVLNVLMDKLRQPRNKLSAVGDVGMVLRRFLSLMHPCVIASHGPKVWHWILRHLEGDAISYSIATHLQRALPSEPLALWCAFSHAIYPYLHLVPCPSAFPREDDLTYKFSRGAHVRDPCMWALDTMDYSTDRHGMFLCFVRTAQHLCLQRQKSAFAALTLPHTLLQVLCACCSVSDVRELAKAGKAVDDVTDGEYK